MHPLLLYPAVVMSLVFVATYWLRCSRSGTDFDLGVMFTLCMHGLGISAGLIAVASIFVDQIRAVIQETNWYFFLAGLAILAVSVQHVHRAVFAGWPSRKSSLPNTHEGEVTTATGSEFPDPNL